MEDFEPKKKWGQNFLTDDIIASEMVSLLEMPPQNIVIEVGAGKGALTKPLSKLSDAKILPVEIDPQMVVTLRESFSGNQNIQIVFADVLSWLPDFEKFYGPAENLKMIGSLPYNITSPLINTIIKLKERPKLAIFLIQKEVGEKIAAKAPDASFLSTFTQTFFEVEYVKTVEKEKFDPTPQVDGAIIKLMRKDKTGIPRDQIDKYEGFLHKGFANPRKMLNKVFTPEELEKIGIDGNKRPQEVTIEKWVGSFSVLLS